MDRSLSLQPLAHVMKFISVAWRQTAFAQYADKDPLPFEGRFNLLKLAAEHFPLGF